MATSIILSAFAFGAALTDARKNKIYNAYLVPGLAAGLILRLLTGGLTGLRDGVLCVLFALLTLIPVYLLHGLGAGDVKLLASLAAFLKYRQLLLLIAVSFVIAGAAGLLRLIVSRGRHRTLHFAVPVFFGVLFLQGAGL